MITAKYDYFEHDADIGVIGRGPTIEAAFEQAAAAMFRVMAGDSQPPAGAALLEVHVSFAEPDVELALVTWLNELLTGAQSEGLLLDRFQLSRAGERWEGEGHGYPWPADAEPGVEVKGATLTMLSVREVDGGWEARCIVDV